jgi:predicted O-methyltransferase YrrM
MFNDIPAAIKERMAFLEAIDTLDRSDGTARLHRLRQIPPETGKFIALLAANCPEGEFIEIGTSAGYSSLWISLALRKNGGKLKTFEILPEKIVMARETFRLCSLEGRIELIEGDFLENFNEVRNVSFCFIDCEKELYDKCFAVVSDLMIPGGLIVADNAINHFESMQPMIRRAESDARFDSLLVPIGKGEFICRRK